MNDSISEINNLTRAVANLESRLNSTLPKLGELMKPSGGLSTTSSAMASSLSQFSSIPIVGAMASVAMSGAMYAMGAMPDVNAVLNMSQRNYRTAMLSPGTNFSKVGSSLYNTMRGGISSPGEHAMMGSYMSSLGVAFSEDPNSLFQSVARNAANSAKYLGMSNMDSAQAVLGLTSGQGSANLLAATGIYTSELGSGKVKSESQIFGEIYGLLTAGQQKMTASEVMDEFYRGNMGASLRNMGLTDVQQQRFLKYAVDKVGGKEMDLSSNAVTAGLLGANSAMGNDNPISATLSIYDTMTGQMQSAEGSYIEGAGQAAELFNKLNPTVETLIQNMGTLNAKIQTFAGTPIGGSALSNLAGLLGVDALTIFNNWKDGKAPGEGTAAGQILQDLFDMGNANKGGPSNLNGLGTTSGGSKMSFATPAAGNITARYGQKDDSIWGSSGHLGIDYGVSEGSSVFAAAPGKVTSNGNSRELGKYITIDHGNGYETTYAHLSEYGARIGDMVSAGQQIAKSGNTGNSTGPHLHFAVKKNGQYENPENFLSGGAAIDPSSISTGSYGSSGYSFRSAIGSSGGLEASVHSVLGVQSGAANRVISVPSWRGGRGNKGLANGTSVQPETGNGGPSSAIGLGVTSGAPPSGGGSHGKVDINVYVQNASEAEARRLAEYVKRVLEDDKILTNMGRY